MRLEDYSLVHTFTDLLKEKIARIHAVRLVPSTKIPLGVVGWEMRLVPWYFQSLQIEQQPVRMDVSLGLVSQKPTKKAIWTILRCASNPDNARLTANKRPAGLMWDLG